MRSLALGTRSNKEQHWAQDLDYSLNLNNSEVGRLRLPSLAGCHRVLCHLDVMIDFFRSLMVTPLRDRVLDLGGKPEVEFDLRPSELFDKKKTSPTVTQLCSTAFTGAEAGVWFFLSRINARTISLSSATSDETAWVEELVLILATTALFLD
ncbi:hypothetical protein Tco_1516451 [Tanacetum coccineum]